MKKKKKKTMKKKKKTKSKEEEKRAYILQFFHFSEKETKQQKVKQTPLKIFNARGARKQPIVIL